jgi:anti-sigma B factor antagonist
VKTHLELVDGAAVLEIDCDHIDAANAKELKTQVGAALTASPRLVLDLSHVQFIDSAGCGAVLSALRNATAAGGDLKVCGVCKTVRSLFQLVRLHKVVDLFNSREEAVRASVGAC